MTDVFNLALLHGRAFIKERSWSADEINILIQNRLCFLCDDEGGFLIGRIIENEAELLTLAVDPICQGQGIGDILLRRFISTSRIKGAQKAFLEVSERNLPALCLYKKWGFVEVDRRKKYYRSIIAGESDCDAVVMQLNL